MTKNELLKLVTKWRENVYNFSGLIDPLEQEHWPSLALGYALGNGLSPEDAQEFQRYVNFCIRLV